MLGVARPPRACGRTRWPRSVASICTRPPQGGHEVAARRRSSRPITRSIRASAAASTRTAVRARQPRRAYIRAGDMRGALGAPRRREQRASQRARDGRTSKTSGGRSPIAFGTMRARARALRRAHAAPPDACGARRRSPWPLPLWHRIAARPPPGHACHLAPRTMRNHVWGAAPHSEIQPAQQCRTTTARRLAADALAVRRRGRHVVADRSTRVGGHCSRADSTTCALHARGLHVARPAVHRPRRRGTLWHGAAVAEVRSRARGGRGSTLVRGRVRVLARVRTSSHSPR